MPSYREIVNRLPYRLRNRFDSMGAFVRTVIEEQERDMAPEACLGPEEVQLIQLLVFACSLEDFFREGSTAARSAVDGFEQLGVPGFTVGGTVFQGRNENVLRGENLADRLRDMFSNLRVFEIVGDAIGPGEMTMRLWRRLQDGREVD